VRGLARWTFTSSSQPASCLLRVDYKSLIFWPRVIRFKLLFILIFGNQHLLCKSQQQKFEHPASNLQKNIKKTKKTLKLEALFGNSCGFFFIFGCCSCCCTQTMTQICHHTQTSARTESVEQRQREKDK